MESRRQQGLFPEALFKFDKLENRVQKHLKNVYSCLAIGMFSATAGAYIHMFTNMMSGSFLVTLVGLGLMVWLGMTKHSKENIAKRVGIYVAFTFCMGMSLGPVLDMAMDVDPSIIPTALLASFVIFGSFTMASLLGNDRSFLFLGGTLMSGLMWMSLMGLLNIFIGSQLLWEVHLYLGLVIFCAFVLYDTQLIVEKCRRGDDDFVWHSVDLFLDFINIFRKLLIILSNKEKKKERN